MENNESDAQKLIPVYGLLSRIRLSSSTEVLETAEALLRTILDTYSKPNLTPQQIEFRAVSTDDPLRHFSDTCRMELQSLARHI
jgi:hypothetical protein